MGLSCLLVFIIIYIADSAISETRKGLKRVTLICLLCPMLVIIHFRKYHIWNEKKLRKQLDVILLQVPAPASKNGQQRGEKLPKAEKAFKG